MTDLINLLIALFLLYLIFKACVFISKRILLLHRLYSLKRECGANIRLHTFLFKPAFIKSKKPDITVQILDTVYRIRLYSGGGITKFVHFANANYSVIHSRLKVGGTPVRGTRKGLPKYILPVGARVRVIPDIEPAPDGTDKKYVDVLLFNPAPAEVSYVTEVKTSIKLAFTGDALYGCRIFTASTFARYAEREYRKEQNKRSGMKVHLY